MDILKKLPKIIQDIADIFKWLNQVGKMEKAEGTGTTITLTNVSFTDGVIKNFIVKANNGSVTTTINGKQLYIAPGNLVAPKLVAGKPAAVWYDAAGDCFFFKASGSVDGVTALADDVVTPKKFVNENGDEVVGTIPDKREADVLPSYITALSGKLRVHPQHGVYNEDSNIDVIDSDFTADKLPEDLNLFGLQGIRKVNESINAAFSIQDSEPTPVDYGHIWIKNAALANLITAINIVETITAGAADGTLMFVVGNMGYNYFDIGANIKLTSGGNAISVRMQKSNGIPGDIVNYWTVLKGLNPGRFFILNKPIVYSKIGGVLDIETTYMWNGTSWIPLSQKGRYVASQGTNGVVRILNVVNDTTLTLNISPATGLGYRPPYFNRDASILVAGYVAYRRNGDIFANALSINQFTPGWSGTAFNTVHMKPTSDGSRIVALGSNGSSLAIRVYTYYNGSYVVQSDINLGTGSLALDQLEVTAEANLIIIHIDGALRFLFKNADGYTYTTHTQNIGAYNDPTAYSLSLDENILYLMGTHPTNGRGIHKFTINYVAKTTTYVQYMFSYSSTAGAIMAVNPQGYIIFKTSGSGVNGVNCLRLSDNLVGTVTFPGASDILDIAFNADGTRAVLCSYYGGTVMYYCSITFNDVTATIAVLTSDTAAADLRGGVAIAPW